MKYLLFLAPLFLATCAPQPKPRVDAAGNPLPEPFVIVSGEARPTDTTRFLAGRPVASGAKLSRLQATSQYKEFSRVNLWRWKTYASPRVSKQIAWQSQYLKPLTGTPRTVVYPFGGPDLLYAMAMFPNASRYVLLGLEPVGNLPDLEYTEPSAVLSALETHAKSVSTQLLHGYFITKDMKSDLTNGPLQGVTPVLLTSLGLMDAQVNSVQSFSAGGNPAVEINFTLPGLGRKTAIYVSGDLSNGGFSGGYQNWLSSVGSGSVAYFKAASYLMHDSSFSSAKNWVLSNCKAVVQDDSGIPYASFDQSQWEMNLFGSYYQPIEFFSKHAQPELRAAYQAAGPRPPLTFGSGYEMKSYAANLTVAVRR
ncbi:hypothetical protein [Luteolibacter sp. AS25]|uniref:hypothetical protein n=1 Tax=Luteolibacter sp. AS25 TaxID=3135776 RepID=UPI00398A5B12